MTIDINELRRKLGSDDLIDHLDIHANVKPALTELLDRLEVAEKEANKINGRMVEVKKRLQLIVEEPSNTMSNAKAMREMLRQANLALSALK